MSVIDRRRALVVISSVLLAALVPRRAFAVSHEEGCFDVPDGDDEWAEYYEECEDTAKDVGTGGMGLATLIGFVLLFIPEPTTSAVGLAIIGAGVGLGAGGLSVYGVGAYYEHLADERQERSSGSSVRDVWEGVLGRNLPSVHAVLAPWQAIASEYGVLDQDGVQLALDALALRVNMLHTLQRIARLEVEVEELPDGHQRHQAVHAMFDALGELRSQTDQYLDLHDELIDSFDSAWSFIEGVMESRGILRSGTASGWSWLGELMGASAIQLTGVPLDTSFLQDLDQRKFKFKMPYRGRDARAALDDLDVRLTRTVCRT